jgi:hypothetical protein
MDTIATYRDVIKHIIQTYLDDIPPIEGMETIALCDETSDNYMVLNIGWQYPQRIYHALFHLRIKEHTIWIEQDGTEEGVVTLLLEAGIPAEAIEMGYQPVEMRPYLEYKQRKLTRNKHTIQAYGSTVVACE